MVAVKYSMRIYEITLRPIKPKPPLNLAQARIHGLQQSVERDRQRLQQERERQQQQRDNERKRKEQQRKTNALKP